MSDAVIVESVRSPGARYRRGGLAQTRADEFGIQVLKGLLARLPQVKQEEIDDLIVGCSFPECEQGMNLGRILAIGAGLPISVSGMTVNDRFIGTSAMPTHGQIRASWSRSSRGLDNDPHPMGGSAASPSDWAYGTLSDVHINMGITAESCDELQLSENMDKFGVK